MSDVPVQPGDILADKYRVERVLGAGNMGVVVAATHVSLGRPVALKFMLPGKAGHKEQRERFLREAQAVARLRSQHVAHVLDVGTLESNAPYIVMELLEGQDLAAVLSARGPLPVEEAVACVLQACEAVGEAHAAGIVHRDLKPANLFLTRDVTGSPCVKVLDFGISKLTQADLTLTHEAQAFGSPLYMSPEQMSASKAVDSRGDIWALGVLLYQLIAGRTPFHAETIEQLCARVLFGEPAPLRDYKSDAPPGLELAIQRCLRRDREQRFQNVTELAAAIAPYTNVRERLYVERVARVQGFEGVFAAGAEVLSAAAPGDEGKGSAQPPPVGPPVVGPPPGTATRLTVTDSAWGRTGTGAKALYSSSRAGTVAISLVGLVAGVTLTTWVLAPKPGEKSEGSQPDKASAPAVERPPEPSVSTIPSSEPPSKRASAPAPAAPSSAESAAPAASQHPQPSSMPNKAPPVSSGKTLANPSSPPVMERRNRWSRD